MTDTPPGSFNYIDDRPRTVFQALDVLNGYLLPRGFVTLRRDEFFVVLKTDNPILQNLIPTVPLTAVNEYGDNELLRVSVPVKGLEPTEVADQLANILGPHGEAVPLDASESVVLQGFGKSLRETVELLQSAVVPPADDELVFRSFPLQHIPAIDAERQVQNLFGLASNPYRQSMARRAEYYRRRSRGRNDDDEDRRAQPTPLVQRMAMNMSVSALRQTNSLLVAATPAGIELIERILKSIDVGASGDRKNVFASNTPELRVYRVHDADEDDVAETVDAVLPGVVINEDGRHNSIHVLATPAEHLEVEELIRIIDRGGDGNGVEVIPLTRSDPVAMSETLESLFRNEDRDDRPVITPDPRMRSLVIRATSGQMAQIKKMLAAYGETSALTQPITQGSRFRNLRLEGNYDSERIARMVQELLRDDDRFGNPIRIVVPSRDGAGQAEGGRVHAPAVPRVKIEAEAERRNDETPADRRRKREANSHMESASSGLLSVSVGRFRDEQPTTEDSPAGPIGRVDDSLAAPRVTIEVRGNDLFIYSNDGVALNQVEERIRELVRQMPSRTEWTVFYLRAAAVEDAGQSIVELLQSDIYPLASLGIGGDEIVSEIGVQPMRIVPDARTNALFVSGPADQVEQAARFLKLLDTTELPESLRDRVPRAIPVEHADIRAVAEMVRELYKDLMEDPNARRNEGRRNGDRDRDDRDIRLSQAASQQPGLRPPGIRLTLAVDEVANELLVSCNEQIFEQIRKLVQDRDRAALRAQPAVRIVPVEDVAATSLQLMLDNLSPRISVSTSPGATIRRTSGSWSSPRRESDGRSDRRDRD